MAKTLYKYIYISIYMSYATYTVYSNIFSCPQVPNQSSSRVCRVYPLAPQLYILPSAPHYTPLTVSPWLFTVTPIVTWCGLL